MIGAAKIAAVAALLVVLAAALTPALERVDNATIDTRLDVPRRLTLESAIEWIADDELVEVTPGNIRARKAILSEGERRRQGRRAAPAGT